MKAPPKDWRRAASACVISVRHPLQAEKRIKCVGATWEEAVARAQVFRTLRRDLRQGLKSRRDVERALWALDHNGSAMSLADAFAMHAAKHAGAERTRSSKRVTWRIIERLWPELASRDCEDVEAPTLRELSRRLLEDGYAERSARTFVTAVVTAVRFAAREGYTSIDKASRTWSGELRAVYAGDFGGVVATAEGRPRSRITSLDELRKLAIACQTLDRKDGGHRCALVLTAAYSGLRVAELAALAWGDISEHGGRVSIAVKRQCRPGWRTHHPEWLRPNDPPKGGKTRFVLLTSGASGFLRDHRRSHESRGLYGLDRPVFPTVAATWPSSPEVTLSARMLASFCAVAGLQFSPPLTPHSLRRSKAYLEHLAKASDLEIAAMLGHVSRATTAQYIHDGRAAVISRIPALDLAVGAEGNAK